MNYDVNDLMEKAKHLPSKVEECAALLPIIHFLHSQKQLTFAKIQDWIRQETGLRYTPTWWKKEYEKWLKTEQQNNGLK